MALPVPAREVAVNDFSFDYGTVKQVKKQSGGMTEITFVNGTVITVDNEMELMLEQGGRF